MCVYNMAEGRGQPKPSGSQWTDVVQCPHHPGAPLIEDHSAGDTICQECGLVVGDRLVEWVEQFLKPTEKSAMRYARV